MKKYITILIVAGLFPVLLTSCLEEYLDKAPEAGLNEEEVFTKYENFLKYFNVVYTGYATRYPGSTNANFKGNKNYSLRTVYPFFHCTAQTWSYETVTPMCDQGAIAGGINLKTGQFNEFWKEFVCYRGAYPKLASMFICIRVANTTLEKISMLKNASQENIDDLIAQAYFVRGFAHFELFRHWGGMPYITKPIGQDDQWDMFRLSGNETCKKVAADMDTAVTYFEKAGRMRRDPGPGQAGHLSHVDQFRPNGCAAMAIKARALLYAASPLNNSNGVSDWEEAAVASWDAIKTAEQYEYDLLSAADYPLNNTNSVYTNEMLFGYYHGKVFNIGSLTPGVFVNVKSNSGHAPSQNYCVDFFETKWGDPLNTKEDRDAATALGHYNEQDPYKDREPRFYLDIIYNQADLGSYGKADIYFENVGGTPVYARHLDHGFVGYTHTGYYDRKHWAGQTTIDRTTRDYTDPLIRLAELYLNYAEAANEAYGPNTAAPGAAMTAVQAVNHIRTRIGQVDVMPQHTTSRELFRPRIKNERNVELCFEGHYYFDIRRWMDAPEVCIDGLEGVDIEKVPVSLEYPTGYKYTRMRLPAERQTIWKPQYYWWPFMVSDQYKMKNFEKNLDW